jgi:hypothetical protein
MPCLGNADKPCCYLKGKLCHYVREHDPRAPERRWACGLYLELGNWDAVLADPRYKKDVAVFWPNGMNCRDWPDAKKGPNRGRCLECGVNV